MNNARIIAVLTAILTLSALQFIKAESSNIVIEVEAARIRPVVTPDSTPLQDIPGLTLRQQGQGNPQTDLSIRGSSFSSAGLLLNGLALRNAQTEHWHASIATPASWLETPAVLTGLERFRYSTGHPAGSVSLSLAPLLSDENRITIGGGNYGNFFSGADLTAVEHLEGSTIGTSAFISYNHADQTDSVAGNYMDRITAGGRVSRLSDKTQADLLATISQSNFGAQGFYGASSIYPAEEELTDSMVLGSLKFIEDPEAPGSLTAAWRRTDDTYTLNRYHPSIYQNEHTTDFFALHGDKRSVITKLLSINSRTDLEFETIESRSLGDHDRSRASLALIPNLTLGDFTLSAGGSAELFSSDSTRFLPAAGAEWAFARDHTLFISYSEALRQPSYTELNYESPDSLGNTGLERQHTRTTELGYKGEKESGRWSLTLFYERATETVDWVKNAPGSRWSAVNLNEIESFGTEALGTVNINRDTEFTCSALILEKDISPDYYAGRYALDYPQFSGDATLRRQISEDLMLRFTQIISKYESNPVRDGGDWLTESSVNLQWLLPFAQQLVLNAGIRNIFDDEFQLYPGQDSLGRSVYSSLTYNW